MTEQPRFMINVVFKATNEWRQHTNVLRQIAGPDDASGMGFGERDMQWYGLDESRAHEIARSFEDAARSYNIPELRVDVSEDIP